MSSSMNAGWQVMLGSSNPHKRAELEVLLAGWPVHLWTPKDFPGLEPPDETGTTFLENALLKARYYHSRTGLPTLSEDSGLEVEALEGEPGVRSARFAGQGASDADNVARLLSLLKGKLNRRARFRTVMVYKDAGGEYVFEGALQGQIAAQPAGTEGFGYDPVFVPEGWNSTLAQAGQEAKNAVSHRACALRRWIVFMQEREGWKK